MQAAGQGQGGRRRSSSAPKKNIDKARTRDSLQALSKLAELVDGNTGSSASRRSWSRCATWRPTYGMAPEEVDKAIHEQFRAYRATLQDDRRHLLERFQLVDVARKVVGVGSVGTRAWIVLLQGRDGQDPLFLQVKEATASVLEDHLPKSRYKQPGERVVQGQRMMQAASDIFLGWTRGADATRHFYWRQLRDMKGSALVEAMSPSALGVLRTQLRVDAGPGARPIRRPDRHRRVPRATRTRSTERSPTSPKRYADQNDRDYQEFVERHPVRPARGARRSLSALRQVDVGSPHEPDPRAAARVPAGAG